MIINKVILSIFTLVLIMSLLGAVYAEIEALNGTDNSSVIGNISANLTNQSYLEQNNKTHSNLTNQTDKAVSTGGIKNFMKSFSFQSSV